MRRSGPGTSSFNYNFGLLDCFASLAMTQGFVRRDEPAFGGRTQAVHLSPSPPGAKSGRKRSREYRQTYSLN